jgi:uncharacterized repeat protein (TIGR03803 family)
LGGSLGSGSVFKLNTDGTGFANLYNFSMVSSPTSQLELTNRDGSGPSGGLVLLNGALYGTTSEGGPDDSGTLFKLNTDGSEFTVLYAFSATSGAPSFTNSDGYGPYILLAVSTNTLCGITRGGGRLFKINADGSGFTVLHTSSLGGFDYDPSVYSFTNSDGVGLSGMTLSGNTLYGTTRQGGAFGEGTVFTVNSDGTDFKVVHSFSAVARFSGTYDGTNNDGGWPSSGVVISGGNLYGTTVIGGPLGGGTIFRVGTDGTGFTTLENPGRVTVNGALPFNEIPGSLQFCALLTSTNNLYGLASAGGASGMGSIFSLGTNGAGFKNVFDFTNSVADASSPLNGLTRSGDVLYGTTANSIGGTSGGTLFSVNVDGTRYATIYDFKNSTNRTPKSTPVVQVGALFGTAQTASGKGTVFKMTTDGKGFTTLCNVGYASNGLDYEALPGDLVLSGNTLYGVADSIFSVNTGGTGFQILHKFSDRDGSPPFSGLILSGGTLYGTALGGGSSGNGTVFSINTDGSGFVTIYNFSLATRPNRLSVDTNSDGALPCSRLTLGTDGMLYGLAARGGIYGGGTLFKVSTNGTGFVALHSFPTAIIAEPERGLGGLVISGETIYGITELGGANNSGTVFTVKTDGTGFAVLHEFVGSEGSNPKGDLLFSNGTLYGTATWGGSQGNGTVFALTLGSSPVSLKTSLTPTGLVLNWSNPALILQTSPAVTSPFTNVPGATSPYTNRALGRSGFFRLIAQ